MPPEIDVRRIRQNLGLTQEVFTAEFGFTTTQIRDWEQGRSRPPSDSRAYLMIIEVDPKAVLDILRAGRKKRAKAA